MSGVGLAIVKPEMRRRPNIKKMDIFAERPFGDLFQRRHIVEHPDRASVRRQHQRVIAWLNLYVVNPHQRQVPFHACPVRATIERHVRAEFRSQKQKILVARMLANHAAGHAGGQISFHRFPCFAVISGNENICAQVIAAVSIESCVYSSFGVARRHDPADIGSLRHAADLTGQILPGLPAVLGDLQITIVGAGIQQPFFDRRFSQRYDLSRSFLSVVS